MINDRNYLFINVTYKQISIPVMDVICNYILYLNTFNTLKIFWPILSQKKGEEFS